MLRRIMLFGIATGAILAVSVWALLRPAVAGDANPSGQEKKSANDPKSSGDQRVAQGSATAPVQTPPPAQRHEGWGDPIVIPAGRLRLIDLEDVPSQRDGVLMFIGTEIKDGQQVPSYEAIHVQIGEETKRFRRLKEGDSVQSDQLLALVDDTLARADVDIKAAKLNSAHAEFKAAEKTRDEALARLDTAKKLFGSGGGGMRAISQEDLRGAQLTYTRYVEEAVSKGQAIKVAEQELIQAKKTVTMYEIRSKVSGIVKSINKHRGEAIKSLEPLLQVQNYVRLRVDATLDEQYANRLSSGMDVLIEPIFRESPRQTFTGHRGDITGIAVSKDPKKPYIVSCSDDRTVRVWELSSGEGPAREHVLKKPDQDAELKAVACTPRDASANLCLAGDAKGNGYLWDLNDLSAAPRKLDGHHLLNKAITCVAFSPDGKTCATGGADMQIMVWNTADASRRFTIAGHRDEVKALYFAPGDRLISVSRHPTDSIRIWELSGDHYKEAKNGIIQRREFLVNNLGVSPDGKHMMDEHFAEMRVITVPDAEKGVPRTEAILRPTVGKKFVNFALFSPDGQFALTTPEREGILQLWRVHFNQGRSYEVRQFVSPVNAVPTSAAFAPDGSFVVAAVKDRVYLWPMPAKDEAGPIRATITNVEKPIDLAKIEVKITAELDNPGQRLRPGDQVTVVAYPQKK
jgi:WD40 repeat protein